MSKKLCAFLSSQVGYTLIEILVAVTIIGLLTGASIAGYNTLNQRQTVLNGGKELMSVMRTAQERATSGVKPTTCAQLIGYSVTAAANGKAYTLSGVCSDATTAIRTYTLPTGVTFVANLATQFSVQTGGAGGTLGDIQVKSSSYTYTMNVNQSGDITEKGLQ